MMSGVELIGGPDDGLLLPPDIVEIAKRGNYGEPGIFCGIGPRFPEYRLRADGSPFADFERYRKLVDEYDSRPRRRRRPR